MRKIGGISMNRTMCLKKAKKFKEYSLYSALEEAFQEVKLIKEGKIKQKTWREFFKELENEKE